MLIPIKFLEYMGFLKGSDDCENEPTAREMLEEHLKESILECSMEHIDTAEATVGSQNLEKLAKAMASLETAESERLRVQLEIEEAKRRQWINWDMMIPKLVGIGVTGAVTVFWICLEQGTPLPMRLVQMASNLTMPRGL